MADPALAEGPGRISDPGREPEVSVVIAARDARGTIAPCLESLLAQDGRDGAEILVVDGSGDGAATRAREFPGVTFIAGPPSALVPELWTIGINQSRGPVVALTSAHCVPAPGWLAAIRAAHRDPVAAVGGVVEPDPSGDLATWAVYFCRYSAYLPSRPAGPADDLAADNASYKRAALERCRHTWAGGFWEPAVHAALRADGEALVVAPAVRVQHRGRPAVGAFLCQRFRHGRMFGRWRAARLHALHRALQVAAGPVVPALLLGRIARRVHADGRHPRQLAAALPWLALFLSAWSLGELAGVFGASAAE